MTHEEILKVAQDEATKLSPKARATVEDRATGLMVGVRYPSDEYGTDGTLRSLKPKAIRAIVRQCYEHLRLSERVRNPAKIVVKQSDGGFTRYRDNEGEFCWMTVVG